MVAARARGWAAPAALFPASQQAPSNRTSDKGFAVWAALRNLSTVLRALDRYNRRAGTSSEVYTVNATALYDQTCYQVLRIDTAAA